MTRRGLLKQALVSGAALAGVHPLLGSRRGRAAAGPWRIAVIAPARTGDTPVAAATYQVPGTATLRGAILAWEELLPTADPDPEVLITSAPEGEAAVRAARRHILQDQVFAVVGGFDEETCLALSELAVRHGVLFFNVGCTSDRLRGDRCNRHTFHVEASAAMYLDALVEGLLGQDRRRWFFVTPDSPEGHARYSRARQALLTRGEGQEVGNALVQPNQVNYAFLMPQIRAAEPDLVFLHLSPVDQLDFLTQYEALGLPFPVTGFPEAASQTRHFFAALRNGAPRSGTGPRAVLWDPSLPNPEASELNQRFRSRWGWPMDASAWAAWLAVKVLWQAASATGSTSASALIEFLEGPDAVFDGHKGIGLSFRPWDHQLRQPLHLVRVRADASDVWQLTESLAQLPPIRGERAAEAAILDRLGDGPEAGCRARDGA